jgi:hypothetical protein
MDPTTPPCLSGEPLPAAVREADGMLGMWAELFSQSRTRWGVEGAMEITDRALSLIPADDVRDLLYAALIRLTEPAHAERHDVRRVRP